MNCHAVQSPYLRGPADRIFVRPVGESTDSPRQPPQGTVRIGIETAGRRSLDKEASLYCLTLATQPCRRDHSRVASWNDARRIEAWAGEIRVNLLRVAAILAFYGHHLLNVYFFQDIGAAGTYHASVTALAIAWSAGAMLLHFALSRRWVPPPLMAAAVTWDLLLVTVLLILSGGPKSPLTFLYLLVVASSALRLSLPLVWGATLGAIAGYIVVLGHARFYQPDWQIPRTAQAIFILGLAVAGLLAGQMVRQARRLVRGYPITLQKPEDTA